MKYRDLREFISFLETNNKLKRISLELSTYLEMTEILDRTIKSNGPALIFESPRNYSMPLLCNLFGSIERVMLGMGVHCITDLKKIGSFLAFFHKPDPPRSIYDFMSKIPTFYKALNMTVKHVKKRNAPCQEQVLCGSDVDLRLIPIMHCWPGDIAPVITLGVTVTQGVYKKRQNLGIYRQQVLDKNKLIIRWLKNRGGDIDFASWIEKYPEKKFPVAISIGSDPAIILSAAIPAPDNISEYSLAGLFRGYKTKVVKCISCDLYVSANSEIILEGYLEKNKNAVEGPFGDHTGYYNSSEEFPIFTVTHITSRKDAIYHSTYSCRPPDESSVIGSVLNELFIPIIQRSFPEIVDFYLPPEGCSYRLAVITIKKQYIGHARKLMMSIWSFLYQFMYIKFIIVCDQDIDARDWKDVIWAITTRVDPIRDFLLIDRTPIDYLDFASPVSGLGSKLGIDATNKWPGEVNRPWGVTIEKDIKIVNYINSIWDKLDIV